MKVASSTIIERASSLLSSQEARDSAVYFSASSLQAGVAFALLPVLTRFLTPADYGIVANYNSLFELACLLVALSTSGLVLRNYYFFTEERLSRNITTALALVAVAGALLSGLLSLLGGTIHRFLSIPPFWLLLIPVLAIARVVLQTALVIFQCEKKPKSYALLQISESTLILLVSVVLVVLFGFAWEGRIIGLTLGTLLAGVGGGLILRSRGLLVLRRASFTRKEVGVVLRWGLPLIPHAVGGWVLTLSDRVLISSLC